MIDETQINDPAVALTIRALYIIDPKHRLRLSMYYPMSTGRNVEYVLHIFFNSVFISSRFSQSNFC